MEFLRETRSPPLLCDTSQRTDIDQTAAHSARCVLQAAGSGQRTNVCHSNRI